MKSLLLSIVFFFSLFSGSNAQDHPVSPLSRMLLLVELKEDFSAFQQKVAQLNLKKADKHLLAEEYSDLIDRMDAQLHAPKTKTEVQISAMKSSVRRNH